MFFFFFFLQSSYIQNSTNWQSRDLNPYETLNHGNKRPKHRCTGCVCVSTELRFICPELHCILKHSKAKRIKNINWEKKGSEPNTSLQSH